MTVFAGGFNPLTYLTFASAAPATFLGPQRMTTIRAAGETEGYQGQSLTDYVRINAQSEQYRTIGSNLGLVGDELAGYVKQRECDLSWRQHREAHGLLHHSALEVESAKYEALIAGQSLERLEAEANFSRHGRDWPFGITRGYSSAISGSYFKEYFP